VSDLNHTGRGDVDNIPLVDRRLVGQVELTVGDTLAFTFSRLRRLLLFSALCSIIFAGLFWLLGNSQQDLAYFQHNPLIALRQFAVDMYPVVLGYFGVFMATTAFCSWLSFRRTPLANRQLTYHVDHLALKTSDASGAELTLPWSLIRQTLVTKQLLLLQMTNRGWRFVPLRAFTTDDQQRLIEIARQSAAKHKSTIKR
jgi:hypothetical protein